MRRIYSFSLISLVAVMCLAALFPSCTPQDKQVVILFTNDTHSQIDPLDSSHKDYPGMGGVERRKALIDSLRAVYPHLLLVDAGDAVQGTPYFNIFGGEIETVAMNAMGYNVRTLGNHEFDNGMEALAAMLTSCNAVTVSTNYDLANTTVRDIVKSSTICDAGGVKIGFIGLNVQPAGLIDPSRCTGMTYTNPLAVADSAAKALHEQGADFVVALSHLGYDDENNTGEPVDSVVVANTRYIDLVIGGHSHTLLQPPSRFLNRDSNEIVIAQTGKSGAYLGFASITIPADKSRSPQVEYRLLPVDSRYDNRIDPAFAAGLDDYRHTVDSLMRVVIGSSKCDMEVLKPESRLTNWVCDAFVTIASERTGKPVDFAIVNTGGVRADIKKGDITRGDLFTAFPFDNYLSVVTLRGKEVKELFDIIALRGGEGVSREVKLNIQENKVGSLTINGKGIDENRLYTIATLDYVANGGDKMKPFTRAEKRTDYPDTVRKMLEAYIARLSSQGQSIDARLDHRITVE